jgi:pyrroloquinoline quinone (PQQ) biosynthesis protein C
MMANLPKNENVLELAENLFEELGLDGNQDSTPHYMIYKQMLESFSLSLENVTPNPETTNLINAMLTHCKNPDPAYGLGALCLGAEALVPPMYSDIIAGFGACGIPVERVDFFRIHVECDDGHAETIRDIMVGLAARDTQRMQIMVDAGEALVEARLAFFTGIEQSFAPVATESAATA